MVVTLQHTFCLGMHYNSVQMDECLIKIDLTGSLAHSLSIQIINRCSKNNMHGKDVQKLLQKLLKREILQLVKQFCGNVLAYLHFFLLSD